MANTHEQVEQTELTLDRLLSQDWIQDDLSEATVSRTNDGEAILWLPGEIYFVNGRSITRHITKTMEEVII
jgi:hypothetical protein